MGALLDMLKEVPLSAVLKEKVSLLEQKFASVDEQLKLVAGDLRRAEAKNQKLEAENQKLQAENVKLQEEIQRLTHDADLHETEKQILVHAGKTNDSFGVEEIAYRLQLDPVRAKYFANKLGERGFIGATFFMRGQEPRFQLKQKGMEYLISNGLI